MQLMPPKIIHPLRNLAADFLGLSIRDQLLTHIVANGYGTAEAAGGLAATAAKSSDLLDLPDADRAATLADIRARIVYKLWDYKDLLTQIDPRRRAPAVAGDFLRPFDPNGYKFAAAPTFLTTAATAADEPTDGEIKSRKVTSCHNCRLGCGTHCIDCKRVEQDDIRIRKSPHAIEVTAYARADPPFDERNRDRIRAVTPLAVAAEDTLRQFLATLAALHPLELLVFLHAADRRPEPVETFLGSFIDTMRSYRRRADGDYRPLRATTHAAFKSITARVPPLAALRSWVKR